MAWIIALGIVTGLAILPVGIRASYDHRGPAAFLLIGPVMLRLYPKMKADKEVLSKKQNTKAAKSDTEAKKGGGIKEFRPLVQTLLELLVDFKSKLRVNNLQLKLILGGGDPCDLALNYGKTWAAIGNIMPRLEDVFTIKKRNIEVECDFTATSTVVIAGVDLTLTVGRLIYLAIRHGFKGLRQYQKIKNDKKAV